jgi:transcriptional regulator GlxA family with amidase domain
LFTDVARELGASLAKFVTKMRLETAKPMLTDGEKSVEISDECGVGSVDSMQAPFGQNSGRERPFLRQHFQRQKARTDRFHPSSNRGLYITSRSRGF